MNSCKTIWQSLLLVGLLLPQSGFAKTNSIGDVELGKKGKCKNVETKTKEQTEISVLPYLDAGALKYRVAVIHTEPRPSVETKVVKYENSDCFKTSKGDKDAYFCHINSEAGEPVLLQIAKEDSSYHLKWTPLPTKRSSKNTEIDWGSGFSCNLNNVIDTRQPQDHGGDPNLEDQVDTEAGITSPEELGDDGREDGIKDIMEDLRFMRQKLGFPEDPTNDRSSRRIPLKDIQSHDEREVSSSDNYRYRPDYERDISGNILLKDPVESGSYDAASEDYNEEGFGNQ